MRTRAEPPICTVTAVRCRAASGAQNRVDLCCLCRGVVGDPTSLPSVCLKFPGWGMDCRLPGY